MTPRSFVHLGRAFALIFAFILLAGTGLVQSQAQSIARSSRRIAARQATSSRPPRPLRSYRLEDLPTQRASRAEIKKWIQAKTTANGPAALAVSPPPAPQQFLDLTTFPRQPLIGDSTKSQEIHPFWSWDQTVIYFSSNRTDVNGATLPLASSPFHVWRMLSDGSAVEQITGKAQPETANNQFFPALNHAQTKLAYVTRDRADLAYQLYVLDLTTGAREQLTGRTDVGNAPSEPVKNRDIVSVEKPSWAPGDNVIAFAARDVNVSGGPRNIYVIDINTKVVRRLTNATGSVEAIDPVYDPDPTPLKERITFASNTTAIVNGDLGATSKSDFDLFTVQQLGASLARPIVRVTDGPADDREPAYNQSVYPPGSFPTQGYFHRWLAFASLGRNGGTTYDIYYFNAPAGPEGPGNQPLLLFTPDTTGGGTLKNGSHERYPTWSAGLPPQNPLDRIAFQSNRQNNPADLFNPTVSNTDTDIWAAEVTDITPPTLLPFDEQTGETLRIVNEAGRRAGAAGDTFTFYARLRDFQSGIERDANGKRRVWAQIKDPDHASQDSNGQNHKLYGEDLARYAPPGAPSRGGSPNNVFLARWQQGANRFHWMHHSYETDYQGIGVNDYQYYDQPGRPDVVGLGRARFASRNPGVDDSERWSGNQNSPFDGVSNRPPTRNGQNLWLELRDDGVAPDQAEGDGIFTAQWKTPNDPSDWYVDLIAYDEAVDPRNPTHVGNWIIYDNIWGFSTLPFVSINPVLFVDDNGAGQKWPRGLKGSFRLFETFRYGTESDCLDRDARYKPKEVRGVIDQNGNEVAPFSLVTPGFGSQDFLHGSQSAQFIPSIGGRGYRYDIWRILARGPVPESVFNDYLPTTQEQPRDITGATTVQQPIPRRSITWNAPYTGDIFLGAGSILDQATQNEITKYRNRGGRLLIAGGDILWSLTVDNAIPDQAFVANVLGAVYTGDTLSFDNARPRVDNAISLAITRDPANSLLYNDLGPAPPHYAPLWDPDWLGFAPNYPGFQDAPGLNDNAPFPPDSDWQGNHEHFTTATDGTPFQQQDGVAPRTDWLTLFQDRMIGRDDAAGTKAKTIFMSFSLASMGRRHTAEDTNALLVSENYRAKLGHAIHCWLFSADLVGQVASIQGGVQRPVPGAWVKCLRGGQIVGSAFTNVNGTYSIRGLPVGTWTVEVESPGFASFQKDTGSGAHGLDQATLDVLLTPAAPGSISGKVTDPQGNPIEGAGILATLQAPPLYTGDREFRATSGPNGTYIIPSAPVGTYVVTVETNPPLFGNPQPPSYPNVRVNPSTNTPNIDFVLTGQPTDLTVKVFAQNADGTKGNPVQDATVKVLDSGGTEVGNGITDATGTLVLPNMPAGRLRVEASASGFQTGISFADLPQQNTVEVLLPTGPARQAGVLSGKVVELGSNNPIAGASVDVIRGASTIATLTTDASGQYATTGTIPGGDYKLTATASGYLPATVNVTVDGDTTAPDIKLSRPATIRGIVKSGVSPGAPIAGATVTLMNPADDSIIATMVTFDPPTGTGTGAYNFEFTGLQPGNYKVAVDKNGWMPKSATVDVALNQVRFLVFDLNPEHIFPRGRALVSLPYDNQTDLAVLLRQSPATFKSAYWVTSAKGYVFYPDPRAATFELGKGVFVRLTDPVAFSDAGQEAPNTVFRKAVEPGWNLIGSVRRKAIEWLRVRVEVQRSGATETLTMQKAMEDGIIGNGLFGYVDQYLPSDFLQPFYGYFMRCNARDRHGFEVQSCTLLIPVDNAAVSVTPEERARYAALPRMSVAEAAAEIRSLGLNPADPGHGVSQPIFGPVRPMPRRQQPFPTNSLLELWPWRPQRG